MRYTDKQRLDWVQKRKPEIVAGNGAFDVYLDDLIAPDGSSEYVRQAIDSAIRAERRGKK